MALHIYTTTVNRPMFLDYQARLLKRFVHEDYTHHVIDESGGNAEIPGICQRHKIEWHEGPNRSNQALSHAAATCLNWAYKRFIKEHPQDTVLWLDSDMFPVADVIHGDDEDAVPLCGVLQYRPHATNQNRYLWNGLVWFNMRKLSHLEPMDWSCGMVNGHNTDTGGATHYFLEKHRPAVYGISVSYKVEIAGKDYSNFAMGFEMYDATWLHYRGGTNWNGEWPEKDKALAEIVEAVDRD